MPRSAPYCFGGLIYHPVCASKEGGLFLYGAASPPVPELSKLRSEVKRKSAPVVGFEDARGKEVSFSVAGFPSWNRRGGRDLKENAAKHRLKGADGVVVSSYLLLISIGFGQAVA